MGWVGAFSGFVSEKGTQMSSLFFFLFLLSSSSYNPPIPKTKQKISLIVQKKTITVSFHLYLALQCMSFCNMSSNCTNKQLPAARRKSIPSRLSLPALTFYGSNPIHKEQFFLCPPVAFSLDGVI